MENYSNENLRENCCKNLNEFRKNQEFTDGIFVIPGIDRKWHIHKVVLHSSNSHFKTILIDAGKTECISVSKITAKQMDILLEYLYTGDVDISLDDVKLIHEAALEFMIKDLADHALDFMIKNINIHKILEFWRYGAKIKNAKLINKCIDYVAKNYDDIFKSFLQMFTFKEIDAINSNITFQNKTNNEKRYLYIVKWLKSDRVEREIHLTYLLKTHINFNLISIRFFKLNIINDKVLQTNRYFLEHILKVFTDQIDNNQNSPTSKLSTSTKQKSTSPAPTNQKSTGGIPNPVSWGMKFAKTLMPPNIPKSPVPKKNNVKK